MAYTNNCNKKKKQKEKKESMKEKDRVENAAICNSFLCFLSCRMTKSQRQEQRITVRPRWMWLNITISQTVKRITSARTTEER